MLSMTCGLCWHTSSISFFSDPMPREWLMLGLIFLRKVKVLLSDRLKVVLTVAIEDLWLLNVNDLLRLLVTLSFTRMLEMKTKTPELVFRMTNMYC